MHIFLSGIKDYDYENSEKADFRFELHFNLIWCYSVNLRSIDHSN